MMCQFRPVPRLERILAGGFFLLGLYGLGRLLFAPIVTGYAQDRAYCFSDFFMHSSVIAVSGFLFFLVFCRNTKTIPRKGGMCKAKTAEQTRLQV